MPYFQEAATWSSSTPSNYLSTTTILRDLNRHGGIYIFYAKKNCSRSTLILFQPR